MTDPPKYSFNFDWNTPYGHVVRLFDQLSIRPGIVLDLGCGVGPVAEPLSERGFKYMGLDVDKSSLDELRARGFDCYEIDLNAHEHLPESLPQLVNGERVAAVLLLDVLEHIPGTHEFLESLQLALFNLDRPPMILSLPNIGHADVGAKLAFGRFDYTPTGLLDETHVSFFTGERMVRELRRLGWMEIAKNDFFLYESDQHFPPQHPALSSRATLARLIDHLRQQVDGFSRVNQFVRAFSLEAVNSAPAVEPGPAPFLCVLVRTTGQRNENLREALTCLAAQTVDDFQVKLMVHSDLDLVADVRAIVDEFHPIFSSRVEVTQVRGGCRGRPLNIGLENAAAEYIAFLDDDDLVTGDWVETFQSASWHAPGQILRSITVNQYVQLSGDGDVGAVGYVVRSSLQNTFEPAFDLMTHLHRNQTPICSFAVPRATVEALNLRFDETLPVTEDWEFLLRAAQVSGVYDTGRISSVYRRWLYGEGSVADVDPAVWEGVHASILERFDRVPLLLPEGSAMKLGSIKRDALEVDSARRELAKNRTTLEEARQALEVAKQELEAVRKESEAARGELEVVRRDAELANRVIKRMEQSLSWRVTFPVRWSLFHLRRIRTKLKPSARSRHTSAD